jgi:uncharacterized protein (TIGR02996 family)
MTRTGDELRAHLCAHPDDVDAHLVYADWLQARGEPLGELIMLHHAFLDRPESHELAVAEGQLLRRHWQRLLGALGDPGGVEREWRLGFIRRACVYAHDAVVREPPPVQLVTTLLALDTALLLEELDVQRADGLDLQPTIDAIVDARPPVLRRLRLGFVSQIYEPHPPGIGELDGLDAALPSLHELTLRGSFDERVARTLAGGAWSLEALSVIVGHRDYEADSEVEEAEVTGEQYARLAPVLSSPGLASLRRLRLVGFTRLLPPRVQEHFPRLTVAAR